MKQLKIRCEDASIRDNHDLYEKYWRPFGELLTDMERAGFRIDEKHMKRIEVQAQQDRNHLENTFLKWVHQHQEDAKEFNPTSTQ